MAIAMGWQKPDNVAGSSAPAIFIGLFVATGGFLFGYDTGAINGILAMREFKDQFGTNCHDTEQRVDICNDDSSIIVAILSVGTFFGAGFAAPAGDYLGRRHALLLSIGVFCIGAIFQVCAESTAMLIIGRLVAGIGVGAISVLVPLYQSEMAPKWIRGTLVCAYQLSITFGLLIAAVVNVLSSGIGNSGAYRIPLGLQIVPALFLTAGILVILPETPRFLVKKGRNEAAGLSLSRLRRLDITHPALIDELQEIVANHQYELSLGPDTYKALFTGSPRLWRRTWTGCALQMLQQLTGINFIMYYSTTFFDGVGVSSPYTKSIIINAVNVASTIPGLYVIESWGRRRLLMIGAAGMFVCQITIAISGEAAGAEATSTMLITFCALNIFFFAASWGPVVWVVTSEIYPLKTRAKAMSLSTASNWALNFAIAYSTPFMVGPGPDGADFGSRIFFIWSFFCLFAFFFVYFVVFETSKISLEQIDEMYERVASARESRNFQPSWSFQQILDQGWSPSGVQPEHELATTTSQTSADTTLGNTNDSSLTINEHAAHRPQRVESKEEVPRIGTVDFSY